jgi:hypothetical protein
VIIRVAKRPAAYVPHRCYQQRKQTLSYCGYASYPEYLASEEWKAIRSKALSECSECRICGGPANQVHHLDYREATLLGLWPERLVQLCGGCHEEIEFENGEKLPLDRANGKLFKLACRQGPGLKKRKKWYLFVRQLEPNRREKQAKLHRTLANRGEFDERIEASKIKSQVRREAKVRRHQKKQEKSFRSHMNYVAKHYPDLFASLLST